jgi:hypothetical protein
LYYRKQSGPFLWLPWDRREFAARGLWRGEGARFGDELWHAGSNSQDREKPKRSSTSTVDNFVDNLPSPPPKSRIGAPADRLLKS